MKKREVKPFLDIETKDTIYKISDVTGYSVKSICEDFYKHSFNNGFGYDLAPYFKRNLEIDGVLFKGNMVNEKFEPFSTENERVSTALEVELFEYAYQLSYAIGCSIAKVVSYAIEKSMKDFEFLNGYAKQFLFNKIEADKTNTILSAVDSLNSKNEEEFNLIALLLYIADEYKRFDKGIKSVLSEVVLTG